MKKFFAALAIALPLGGLLPTAAAQAFDSMSAEVGNGTKGVDMWRLGLQWTHEPRWLQGSTHWSLYWDLSLANWLSDTGSAQDAGITPTFRYGHEHGPYLDGGIGVHWVSELQVSSLVLLSTKFQFGDHLGAGYRWDRYDISMRLQHLSNAGIRNPNPGVNFLQIRFQYWMDKP